MAGDRVASERDQASPAAGDVEAAAASKPLSAAAVGGYREMVRRHKRSERRRKEAQRLGRLTEVGTACAARRPRLPPLPPD